MDIDELYNSNHTQFGKSSGYLTDFDEYIYDDDCSAFVIESSGDPYSDPRILGSAEPPGRLYDDNSSTNIPAPETDQKFTPPEKNSTVNSSPVSDESSSVLHSADNTPQNTLSSDAELQIIADSAIKEVSETVQKDPEVNNDQPQDPSLSEMKEIEQEEEKSTEVVNDKNSPAEEAKEDENLKEEVSAATGAVPSETNNPSVSDTFPVICPYCNQPLVSANFANDTWLVHTNFSICNHFFHSIDDIKEINAVTTNIEDRNKEVFNNIAEAYTNKQSPSNFPLPINDGIIREILESLKKIQDAQITREKLDKIIKEQVIENPDIKAQKEQTASLLKTMQEHNTKISESVNILNDTSKGLYSLYQTSAPLFYQYVRSSRQLEKIGIKLFNFVPHWNAILDNSVNKYTEIMEEQRANANKAGEQFENNVNAFIKEAKQKGLLAASPAKQKNSTLNDTFLIMNTIMCILVIAFLLTSIIS